MRAMRRGILVCSYQFANARSRRDASMYPLRHRACGDGRGNRLRPGRDRRRTARANPQAAQLKTEYPERSQVILVLTQDEAQTLAAYVRLHRAPGPRMRKVRAKLEAEIEAGLDAELGLTFGELRDAAKR